MKKSLLLVAILIATSFASCKKDYACKCNIMGFQTTSNTFNDTRKNAKKVCDDMAIGGGTCEAEKQ